MYKIAREPSSLDDFNWEECLNPEILILRGGNSIIRVLNSPRGSFRLNDRRGVFFSIRHVNKVQRLCCAIFGRTDEDVAETATWFWSLKHPKHPEASLHIEYVKDDRLSCEDASRYFNVAAFSPKQLEQIFDANPTRKIELQTGPWTPEQARVMATRSYLFNFILTSERCFPIFMDEGAAIRGTLEGMPFYGLKQLLNLDNVIEKLTTQISDLDEYFTPFSTKVKTLDYESRISIIRPHDLDFLDIVTKDLSVTFKWLAIDDRDGGKLVAFITRVAHLGHFERLCLDTPRYSSFPPFHPPLAIDDPEPVVRALIAALSANNNLTHLTLSNTPFLFSLGSPLNNVFDTIAENERLRVVTLHPFPPVDEESEVDDNEFACRPYYSALERLLSGKRITNGSSIDEIYAHNYIYTRFTKIAKEPTSLRPSLVAAAVTECASSDFPYSAQLLSFHTDMLCELMNGTDVVVSLD